MNDARADDDIAARVAAALLDGVGRVVNLWSLAVTAAALVIVGLQTMPQEPAALLLASAACGVLEAAFAARVAFDARLFRALGGDPDRYAVLDRLLAEWGLAPAANADRPLDQRIAGARRLLTKQIVVFSIQGLAFVGGLAMLLATEM